MILLVTYVLIAVGFSFLCSIAEAVILSVSTSYIVNLEQEGRAHGALLRELKEDINSPLAVILTLNTIAHTVGAAGAGAQAASVFGSVYVGVFSAGLTLLILIFSEIIPKALGAHYWRDLARTTAYVLKFLVRVLYPFVVLSNTITKGLSHEPRLRGFSRDEFAAMATLGEQEGQLATQESAVLRNLFQLRETRVKEVMTPRSVVYGLPADTTVSEALEDHAGHVFSRIPLYGEEGGVTGFVLRTDLLVAQAEGQGGEPLTAFCRDLEAILDQTSLFSAFEEFLGKGLHIMLVVDEYGSTQGIVTLEDILERLIGLQIMDESDNIEDMQELARRVGAMRLRRLGLGQQDDASESDEPE